MQRAGSILILACAAGVCAAGTPDGNVATPRMNISTPRVSPVSTPGAVITAPNNPKPPAVRIEGAVGGGGCGGYGGHGGCGYEQTWYHRGSSGQVSINHKVHPHGYCSPYAAYGPVLRPYSEDVWVSVPIKGRHGAVVNHAYYWHPAIAPPLEETARRIDPQLMGLPGVLPVRQDPEPVRYRIEDSALEAMRAKAYKLAARLYQQRWMAIVDSELGIDSETQAGRERDLILGALGQSHAEVLELRAMALVGAGRYDDAALELERAYELDPSLEQRGVFGNSIIEDSYALRQLVTRAVRHAHKVKTSGAWRLVAMLMRAEGRDDVARRMLERAAELESVDNANDAGDGERPLSIFGDR